MIKVKAATAMELTVPQRGIEILAEAVRRGSGNQGTGVTINLNGPVYGYDDFIDAVNDAMTSAIMV